MEDFRRDGKSVGDVRRARFGNGWVRSTKGDWVALTRARFTASGAEWESKENINAGVNGSNFILVTGGDTRQEVELRSYLTVSPPGLVLPESLALVP